DVERAGVDQLGARAVGADLVAAVAAALRPAVAVGVGVVVDDAVAVVVDRVRADVVVRGQHLALARAVRGAVLLAGLEARDADALPLGAGGAGVAGDLLA